MAQICHSGDELGIGLLFAVPLITLKELLQAANCLSLNTNMSSRIVDLIQGHIREGAFEGAAVVVSQRGSTWEHFAGNAAPGLPSSPTVLWPLASISKVYTASMIMRLVETGILTLSAPLGELIPSLRGGNYAEVRLRHLLTHTAGMPYESPQMSERLAAKTSRGELIEEALSSTPLFRPGTALRYSDYHYLIAGYVAEAVSGIAFEKLMRCEVFEAAGLRETFLPPSREDEHRLAKIRGVLAEQTDGAMYNSRHARELAHPAFGVFATARDLVRFGLLFTNSCSTFLAPASLRLMTTNQAGGVQGQPAALRGYSPDLRMPWGIGFALQPQDVPGLYCELASVRSFGHGGASGCVLLVDPQYDLVVGVQTNTHMSTGIEAWYFRLQSIINCIFADWTRRPARSSAEA